MIERSIKIAILVVAIGIGYVTGKFFFQPVPAINLPPPKHLCSELLTAAKLENKKQLDSEDVSKLYYIGLQKNVGNGPLWDMIEANSDVLGCFTNGKGK